MMAELVCKSSFSLFAGPAERERAGVGVAEVNRMHKRSVRT